MRQYEIMILFDVQLSDEERETTIDKVKSTIKSNNQNEILKTVDLGIKSLAYPINKKINGYYYLMYFKSEPSYISKISNKFKFIEGILRFLIVLSDEDIVIETTSEENEEVRSPELWVMEG